MKRWIVILLLAFVATSASAQTPTQDSGHLFLRDCQAALENKSTALFGVGYCFGYLDGLTEGEERLRTAPSGGSGANRQWSLRANA